MHTGLLSVVNCLFASLLHVVVETMLTDKQMDRQRVTTKL